MCHCGARFKFLVLSFIQRSVSWDNSLIFNPQRHIHKRWAQAVDSEKTRGQIFGKTVSSDLGRIQNQKIGTVFFLSSTLASFKIQVLQNGLNFDSADNRVNQLMN